MSGESWETPQHVKDYVLKGIMIQAEGFGLDINDPKVIEFMIHQADVIAHYSCQCAWLQRIIHSEFKEGEPNE